MVGFVWVQKQPMSLHVFVEHLGRVSTKIYLGTQQNYSKSWTTKGKGSLSKNEEERLFLAANSVEACEEHKKKAEPNYENKRHSNSYNLKQTLGS